MTSTTMGIVADGVDACRKAARHNLKAGSDFIKVHVSGGVASPTDPLESIQYTPEELEAVVTECRHRDTDVAAHAYLPEAMQMAVGAGVHSIEHGNLLDAETAAVMAEAGTVMVPTLSTYYAMDEIGRQLGMPERNLAKNVRVLEAGLTSLEIAANAGVTLAYGTDLLGESQPMQAREFAIRSEVQPAEDILRDMWIHTARLCHLDLFGFRSSTSANIGSTFYGLAFVGGALASSLMLQDVWDLPIREVGLVFAPSPVLAAIVSSFAGRWADCIGHRWIQYVPVSLLLGIGVGMTVSTWSSAGVADVPPARFGVAGATLNTLRQAATGLGVVLAVSFVESAGDDTSLLGVQRAYVFVTVGYLLAAASVALTFPSGSARDRAQGAFSEAAERPQGVADSR